MATITLDTLHLLARLSHAPLFLQPQVVVLRDAAHAELQARAELEFMHAQVTAREGVVLGLGGKLRDAMWDLARVMVIENLHVNNGLERFGVDLDNYDNHCAENVLPCIRWVEHMVLRIADRPWMWPPNRTEAFAPQLLRVVAIKEQLKAAEGPLRESWKGLKKAEEQFEDAEQDWEIAYFRLKRHCRKDPGLFAEMFGEGKGARKAA